MQALRRNRSLPEALIGAFAFVLAMAGPVAGASAGSAAPAGVLADHVDPDDCEEVGTDAAGNITVNGTPLTPAQLSDSLKEALLRLTADAVALANADACLDVEAAGDAIIISGHLALCGDVTFEREAPPETPIPDPNASPILGPAATTIDGVAISDRLLAVDSYAALEVAAAAGVEACFFATVVRNDAWLHTILTVCTTARLGEDRSLALSIGGNEYRLSPAEIIGRDAELEIGTDFEAALEIVTLEDEVVHLASMTVTVSPVDPVACSPDAPPPIVPGIPGVEAPTSEPPEGTTTGGPLATVDPMPYLLLVLVLVGAGLAVWLFRKA
jgi:hypothetical protein